MGCVDWAVHIIIILITGGLVLKVGAAGNECQVSSVAVTANSTTFSIKYNLTLNNASLCQDVENMSWKGQYVPCTYEATTVCFTCQGPSKDLKMNSGDSFIIQESGKLRLMVLGKNFMVEALSECFSIKGQNMMNDVKYEEHYSTKGLTMAMSKDERVKKASIIVYKATTPHPIPCSDKYVYQLDEIETLHQDRKHPQIFRSSSVFNRTDCLCFKQKLEGFGRGPLVYQPWINSTANHGNCSRPFNEDENEEATQGWKIALIVAILAVGIAIAVVVAVSKRRWQMNRTMKVTPEKLSLQPVSEILVLYSRDMVASSQLQKIRDDLAKHWKISDLWTYNDPARHVDENAWVESKVSGDSSVKVAVVESPGLHSVLNSIRDGKSNEDLGQPVLKFALRQIIATNPCNYNRIYIIRLGDGDDQGQGGASQFLDDDRNSVAVSMTSTSKKQQQSHSTHTEGFKDWDFLVGRRRYLLPGHYTTFMADLGADAEAAGKQREKAYV